MSDSEEHHEEEEEQQEEEEEQQEAQEPTLEAEPEAEAPPEEEKPKPKKRPEHVEPVKEMNETERAIAAAKKRHEEEEAQKIQEFEEQRKIERERQEEELRQLKEKQERRRKEREEEERTLAERKKADEERRRLDEEERKAKQEAEKAKKEEEKARKAAVMGGLPMGAPAGTGPNFVVPGKSGDKQAEKFDKFGNIVTAKAEMGMTKEQQDEVKRKHLADLNKGIDTKGMDISGLRQKVKELHQRICKLEALRYDLEQRSARQEYDVKELSERQRQINRNKALKKGLDPEAAANARYPPKVAVASKYDRQVDRRSYGDRRDIFESPPKPKKYTIFRGTARPPNEWGTRKTEELENLRKILEPPKYQEVVKVEGALPLGMVPIPSQMPDVDEYAEECGEEEEE